MVKTSPAPSGMKPRPLHVVRLILHMVRFISALLHPTFRGDPEHRGSARLQRSRRVSSPCTLLAAAAPRVCWKHVAVESHLLQTPFLAAPRVLQRLLQSLCCRALHARFALRT